METLKTKQRKILKRIRKRRPVEEPPAEGVLQAIKDYSKEESIYAMGDFGRKLRNFARNVDLSHPDLNNIFDGQLVGDGQFSIDAVDLLKLSTYGKSWGLSTGVRTVIKRVVTGKKIYKTLDENIESPTMNLRHVRFMGNRTDRNICRSKKKAQSVSLTSLYNENVWGVNADDFENFWHGKIRYEADIKEAEKRIKRLLDNGLTSMAGEIQLSIDEMTKKSVELQYMGFNSMSLVSVAAILAKMMGYMYEENVDETNCSACYIPSGTFEEHQYRCGYMPIVYPYQEFYSSASDEIKKLIDYLEEYPPLGGHTVFDHYRILAPGGLWKESNRVNPRRSYFGLNDEVWHIPDVSVNQKEMDKALIQGGKMAAVLLGERDGEHYFISYWM